MTSAANAIGSKEISLEIDSAVIILDETAVEKVNGALYNHL